MCVGVKFSQSLTRSVTSQLVTVLKMLRNPPVTSSHSGWHENPEFRGFVELLPRGCNPLCITSDKIDVWKPHRLLVPFCCCLMSGLDGDSAVFPGLGLTGPQCSRGSD